MGSNGPPNRVAAIQAALDAWDRVGAVAAPGPGILTPDGAEHHTAAQLVALERNQATRLVRQLAEVPGDPWAQVRAMAREIKAKAAAGEQTPHGLTVQYRAMILLAQARDEAQALIGLVANEVRELATTGKLPTLHLPLPADEDEQPEGRVNGHDPRGG